MAAIKPVLLAAKDFGLELIKVKNLSKLSKVSLIVMQQSVQGVVFLFLTVLVSGEDLHDFLGLNVPFFNRDSGCGQQLQRLLFYI